MNEFVKHYVVGNDAAPEAIGLTRGIVLAGIMGIMNAILIFMPISAETKVELLAALNPTIGLLSYFLFAKMDKWLKGTGRKL